MSSRNRKRDIRRSTHGSRGPLASRNRLANPERSRSFLSCAIVLPDGEIPSAVRQGSARRAPPRRGGNTHASVWIELC
jgi:hypothetical protein